MLLQTIHLCQQPTILPSLFITHRKKGLELEKYRYKIHYIQETVLAQKGIINSLLSNIGF